MKKEIRQTAEQLIEKYDTNNPFELAEKLGVCVYYADLPDRTRGFCFTGSGDDFICINALLAQRAAASTCAHELGHLVLHRGDALVAQRAPETKVPAVCEAEADAFAAAFLPDKFKPVGNGDK